MIVNRSNIAALCTLIALSCSAQTKVSTAASSKLSIPESLRNEANMAIDRAEKWLLKNQQDDGHWSSPEFPALTAFPVWALTLDGKFKKEPVEKAVAFILANQRPNGSIWASPSEERKGGGLPNYNTAISMTGLHMVGDEKLRPAILKARKFMVSSQHGGDDIFKGGFGYDNATGRPYTDLSNTYIAAEAMRLTESAEDFRPDGSKVSKLDRKALADYVTRLQMKDGGIIYKPNESKASSTEENKDGAFRSYGSMTYAGLLTMIYSDVDKGDPRVKSAFDWSRKHWSLDTNPGMGNEGLFYFYNVLSKALAAMDIDTFEVGEAKKEINWRTELTHKLISLQKIEADGTGFWTNPESRWMEADPTLVTSYALIALKNALN
ncbi:MAG: squalene-hopene/tetraprenyl-beta-curcumene cyclase [Kiritimatiellia bacterium]|jgi:squalene-hopene/tetraprenyl-beta-curcumene cyclase